MFTSKSNTHGIFWNLHIKINISETNRRVKLKILYALYFQNIEYAALKLLNSGNFKIQQNSVRVSLNSWQGECTVTELPIFLKLCQTKVSLCSNKMTNPYDPQSYHKYCPEILSKLTQNGYIYFNILITWATWMHCESKSWIVIQNGRY